VERVLLFLEAVQKLYTGVIVYVVSAVLDIFVGVIVPINVELDCLAA